MLKPWHAELLVVAGIFLVGFGAGYGVRDFRATQEALQDARRDVKAVNDVIRVEQKSDQATQTVAEEVATKTQAIQVRTVEIIKEVPVYVTVEADAKCDVTDGFVRLHDAAATGTPPVPYGPGESPDTPGGVEASTIAATVAENYGQCLVWKSQVEGWQSWYAAQRSLWPTDGR